MEGMENVSHQLLQYNCTERQLADRSELDALLNAGDLKRDPARLQHQNNSCRKAKRSTSNTEYRLQAPT